MLGGGGTHESRSVFILGISDKKELDSCWGSTDGIRLTKTFTLVSRL